MTIFIFSGIQLGFIPNKEEHSQSNFKKNLEDADILLRMVYDLKFPIPSVLINVALIESKGRFEWSHFISN